MTATLLGALATAGVLGVTHAMEPDHVAGISSLTSRHGDARLSALVGACFSIGHVALVVLWLSIGYLVLGRTDYPPLFDAIGTLGVAVILGILGAVMAVGGLRSVMHAHEHRHDGEAHTHSHLHLPWIGADEHSHDNDHGHGLDKTRAVDGHDFDQHEIPGETESQHDHDHGVRGYLKTGLVGALFTLSPPLSMILFSSTLFPTYGVSAVALAVVVYAVAITGTMSLVGAGVGSLFGVVTEDPRIHGVFRGVGGVVVSGFALSLALDVTPAIL